MLARASRLLLPADVRQAVRLGSYKRLLIVPSRNLGDIPYAALPIDPDAVIDDTRALIDFVSVMVLPSFTGSGRMRSIGYNGSLVVGDPLLKQPDKLVKPGMFEPLPGAQSRSSAGGTCLALSRSSAPMPLRRTCLRAYR